MKFGLDGLELMLTIFQISDLQKLQVVKQAIKSSNTVEYLQSFL
ncbi:hypothetical protein [Anabaena sp. CCY 0017]